MAAPKKQKAVIVGAGIVGAASAYFLSQADFSVQVIDTAAPAAAASGSADGAVSVASKRPGPLMQAAIAGVETYRELSANGLFAGLFKERSTYMVAQDADEDAVLEQHAATLSGSGIEVRPLSGATLHGTIPVLAPDVRSAIEVRGEGHAIGYEIVHRLLAASGAQVLRGCTVRALISSYTHASLNGLDTTSGLLEADVYVLAAGGGSGALLGLENVLRPRKGQLLVTERAPRLNAGMPGSLMSCRYLMSKDSTEAKLKSAGRRFGLVVDPLRTGQFLIGGTREETSSRDTDLAAARLILSEAVSLVPGLASVRLLRSFAGVRTATADGRPLIGRSQDFDNLVVATGFEGDGICLGPLTGRIVSQLASATPTAIDLAPFDPARFSAQRQVA
jgi:glycine/D-amino acid oxidase-like deaminating enzyme